MLQRLFTGRSIVPALDVKTLGQLAAIVQATAGIDGVSAYKLPGFLAIDYSLGTVIREVCRMCGDETRPLVVFDYQKAGNDIPAMGGKFFRKVREAGADAAILFPFTGPATQREWTRACIGEGITPIIGGEMTHEEFFASEGGYIADDAPERIYRLAIEMGVNSFIIPGNKLDRVRFYTAMFTDALKADGYSTASPGLITQGGEPSATGQAAGDNWGAIVGRAVVDALDPAAATKAIIDQLRAA